MAANPTTSLADLRATSKMVAKDAGIRKVKNFFEAQKGTLAAVLPKHVNPDRMLKIALGALRTTPKLMNCSVESLMGAVVHCSQLGLEPNTPLGHAYLIPFENRKKGITEVQIVLGYKGPGRPCPTLRADCEHFRARGLRERRIRVRVRP